MIQQHNVFISYAWVDNEVFPGSEKGWVQIFVDGLRKHLARELGRRCEAERLWLDYEQMRGNESVTPTIRFHVEASRTLVLFLSNGYVASPWCRQELEAFVNMAGMDSGRIFVVQMSPVDEEPEPLRDLQKYRFWYFDDERRPCTRWFPDVDPTDREYAREQQRLARNLADKLRDLIASGEAPLDVEPATDNSQRPVPAEEPAPISATPAAPLEKGQSRFILVNGGVDDRDLVYAIANRLGQHNLDVAVPLSALADQSGLRSSTITRDLRDKLSLCDSVLMVYRRGPMDQVSQHLIECLKTSAKSPKGRSPPTIDLCQTQANLLALGVRTRGMRVHVVGDACAEECVEAFLDEITS